MSDYLVHYGVKGMKWGIRRYQRKNGHLQWTLTTAGKGRNKKAENRRSELANDAKRKSEYFSRASKDAKRNLDRTKKIPAKEFEKYYDDDELLEMIGGAEGAKKIAIQDLEDSASRYREYAQSWMKTHDDIMNAPVEDFYSRKTWKRYRVSQN